jgi:hypothetical protein
LFHRENYLDINFRLLHLSRSNMLSSGTLEVIPTPKSATKQEHRRAYCRKRPARGPSAVEPWSITSPCSSFTDCESDSVTATNSNCEKNRVTSSALPIRDTTSVSVVKSFLNRSFSNSIQYSIPNYPPRCVIELPVIRKSFALPTITINPGIKPPQPRIFSSKLLHLVLPIIHLPFLTSSAELCESLQMSEEDTTLPSFQTTMALDAKVYTYFKNKNWCVYCGSALHRKYFQLFCTDCKQYHIFVKCQKNISMVTSPRSRNFAGDPNCYHFCWSKLGVMTTCKYSYLKNRV